MTTQKLKFWQDSKTKIGTKVKKNSSCKKTKQSNNEKLKKKIKCDQKRREKKMCDKTWISIKPKLK